MALDVVSVIVVEPVAVFEFGVAVEVFGLDRTDDGVPTMDFRVCAEHPGQAYATQNVAGFSITPDRGLDAVRGSDLVVVAATPMRDAGDYPEAVVRAIREAHDAGSTILSLCSGAFMLGAAGLLDGRRCTTHWKYFDQLAEMVPEARIDRRALFVEDGRIVTSAGTAAGIDASLHIVRRELGTQIATKIARRMVVPPQRDGGQQQFVETPIPPCSADSLAPLLGWVSANLVDEHTAESMARWAAMSERTFARRFSAETGTTPHKWLTQQRVLAARLLLEESDLGIDQIAGQVGFGSAVVLRDHFRRATGLAPAEYRRRFVCPAEAVAS
jgi:transcriptional regulator GlxA family with amidase domain